MEGELERKLQIERLMKTDGAVNGSVVNARIKVVLDDCLQSLLRGQPELSPQTLRWLKDWFGFDYDKAEFESVPGKNPRLLKH